jgi:hypothetical protein
MKRVDICASDDFETIALLTGAIRELGGRAEGGDGSVGVGLHRYRFPEGELTVFVDSWSVDIAGPGAVVDRVLAAMDAAE